MTVAISRLARDRGWHYDPAIMGRPNWLKLLRGALLVAVLLVTQTAVLSHIDADDAHPGSDTCVLCVGLSTLGAANVAAPVVIAAARIFELLPGHTAAVRHAARIHVVLPRGPPAVS